MAFLSGSGNYVPVPAKPGSGAFFQVPSIPASDPCMSELNQSCTFLGGDSCYTCASKLIGTAGSAANASCYNSQSRGRWWGAHIPRLFCNKSSGIFDFGRSPIVEYCVEVAKVAAKLAPGMRYPNGVPYTSCNAPEGEPFGSTPREPLCISACYADRVIAHQVKNIWIYMTMYMDPCCAVLM